jgi:hypothetical protein
MIMTLECTDEGKEEFANWIQTTHNICTAAVTECSNSNDYLAYWQNCARNFIMYL